ncbi:MAG: VCBS repeat domain-containing M23 family metallopeptidase [Patescibacteria group bacterium]
MSIAPKYIQNEPTLARSVKTCYTLYAKRYGRRIFFVTGKRAPGKIKPITKIFLQHKKTVAILVAVFCIALAPNMAPRASAAEIRNIVFPVFGPVSYSNDFGAPRSGGRTHEGNDIFAEKMRPLLAAVSGRVQWATFPEASYGWGVEIKNADGWSYRYLHINNDTPGTDDGLGGGRNAFVPGVMDGAQVKAGQMLGYIGDSGNAETTPPHLHFEIRMPDGTPINPYDSLHAATHLPAAVPRDALVNELLPYGDFTGGASVAVGDVDAGSPGEELVVATGPGGGPNVRIYSASGKLRSWFFAYAESFHGGLDVATGDVNGDGVEEIITGAGPGGGPHVRIFNNTGKVLKQFFAYGESSRHGVRVAAADMTGDGIAEIITGPAVNESPNVRVFRSDGTLLNQFLAYAETFRGGIDVAAHAATDVSPAVIITGAGSGGGPHVRVFNINGKVHSQFFAYDERFRGGVRVSVADQFSTNDGPEIFTAPANNGGPDFKAYSLQGNVVATRRAFEPWWKGSYDVAAGTEQSYVASGQGGREASVWLLQGTSRWRHL